MKLSKRKQTLAKEKEKEMVEKNQKNHDLRKQQDTIVYPQTNHVYYCVSGLLMDYPLEKLFE